MGGTDVDPIRDVDWIWIIGPSLIHTEKDAAILRYNLPVARAMKDLAILSKHDVGGGVTDAGVPGVVGGAAHAGQGVACLSPPAAERGGDGPPRFREGRGHRVLPRRAHAAAPPEEAARTAWWKNPHHPMPSSESLTEMRLGHPRARIMADVHVEADAPDAYAAELAAREIRKLVAQSNSLAVKIVTRGLLDDLEVISDGSKVRAHGPVSQQQLEAVYDSRRRSSANVAAARLGGERRDAAPVGFERRGRAARIEV